MRGVSTVRPSRQAYSVLLYKVNTYVDRPETCTVAGSHVLVERLDGVGTGELTELLVHVVRAGTRVVTEPDTEVLDLLGTLLVDLQEVSRAR